jgi:hypothetical protein
LHPKPAGAGIGFDEEDGMVVARATDTTVGADEMTAAFLERGLDVTVRLVPTSPSLVATIAGLGVDHGRYDGVQVLEEGTCWSPGRGLSGCKVGLLIPKDFDGQLEVIFGRTAAQGEPYAIGGDVFSRSEALHCSASRVLNRTAAAARTEISSRGVTVDWWKVVASDAGSDPSESLQASELTDEIAQGRYVTAVQGLSDGHVGVLLSQERDAILTADYLTFANRGCTAE